MNNSKDAIFEELFMEHTFLFQLEVGLLLLLKKQNFYSEKTNTSKNGDFHFEVLSMSTKPMAVFIGHPKQREIELVRNISLSDEQLIQVSNFFGEFFTTLKLKSLFV